MSAQKNILIVDDDDFVLKILEKSLNDHPDYTTITARNGSEASKMVDEQDFDLIITDIIMPGKDGIQFIDDLRKTDKSTPVIVITGGDDGEDNQVEQYINFAGYFANETLTKPFTKDELYQSIDLVLNNSEANILRYF